MRTLLGWGGNKSPDEMEELIQEQINLYLVDKNKLNGIYIMIQGHAGLYMHVR